MQPDQILAKNESSYSLPPEGEYRAVCVDAIDIGLVESKMYGTWQHKIALVFQTEEKDPKTGKRYELAERFTLSLHPKARLNQFLSQWRGRTYKESEAKAGVDIAALVGHSAQINVEHNAVGEKTFANIFQIRKWPKGVAPIVVTDYVRQEYWSRKKEEYAQQKPQPSGTKVTHAGPGLDESQEDLPDADNGGVDDSDLPF